MAISRKLKAIDAKNNSKIDTFFKPIPKKKVGNDENRAYIDENKRKTPSPPNSQQPAKRHFGDEKRQFGNVKSGGLKALSNNIRIPLSDKIPQKPLLASTATKESPSVPQFAVLCDEDIEKGVEKAPTPPNVTPVHSQENSQDEQRRITTQAINTQVERSDDDSTQMTATSPIAVYFDENEQDFQSTPFELSQPDENEEDLFTKTKDSTVAFEGATERSFASFHESFFSDDNDNKEDSKSTEDNFFSDNGEEEDGGFSVYVDPDLEFSLTTVSQEPETVSQLMMSLSNSHEKDILDKLNLKRENEEEEEDDGLPIF